MQLAQCGGLVGAAVLCGVCANVDEHVGVCARVCVLCVVCMSGNKLGFGRGAAVAEAMKSCKQLTSVNLASMYCVMVCC